MGTAPRFHTVAPRMDCNVSWAKLRRFCAARGRSCDCSTGSTAMPLPVNMPMISCVMVSKFAPMPRPQCLALPGPMTAVQRK
eukprot:8296311-Pyramimonas_sp.AAC.1